MLEKNSRHQYINEFNPDITVLDTDYREDLTDFDAGIGNENFNVFLKKDVDEYRNEGNSVTMLNFVLGFKALFLHSVPDAELFYLKNGFQDMRINMQPFANVDSDMRPMWLPLKDIHMNYETE